MAPVIDANLVFFLLSFQVPFDMLGMMVLISVDVNGGVRDGFLCTSLLHSILLIVIFHFIPLHLHIVLYYLVMDCMHMQVVTQLEGGANPCLCVCGTSYAFLHVHKTASTNQANQSSMLIRYFFHSWYFFITGGNHVIFIIQNVT